MVMMMKDERTYRQRPKDLQANTKGHTAKEEEAGEERHG